LRPLVVNCVLRANGEIENVGILFCSCWCNCLDVSGRVDKWCEAMEADAAPRSAAQRRRVVPTPRDRRPLTEQHRDDGRLIYAVHRVSSPTEPFVSVQWPIRHDDSSTRVVLFCGFCLSVITRKLS